VNTENIVITQQNGVPTVVASTQLLQVIQQAQAQAQVQLQPQVQMQQQVQPQVQQIQQQLGAPRWEAPKSQSVTLDTHNLVLSSLHTGKNGPASVRSVAPVVSSAPHNFLGTSPGLLLGGLQANAPAVSLAATSLAATLGSQNDLGGTIIIGAPAMTRATPSAAVTTSTPSVKNVVTFPVSSKGRYSR